MAREKDTEETARLLDLHTLLSQTGSEDMILSVQVQLLARSITNASYSEQYDKAIKHLQSAFTALKGVSEK